MTRDNFLIVTFVGYTITLSIGGPLVAWSILPTTAAGIVTLLSVLFWPIWLTSIFCSTPELRDFSGQIDHPGGGIGAVLAMSTSLMLFLNGNDYASITSLILGIPVLGIAFSLLSEWFECQVISSRFRRYNQSRSIS